MSPRKPAVLRDRDGQNLREYLIAVAARLIAERGTAGLAVRDIAGEAQVAGGVLYNYFEDKEDLLAHALLAHVSAVMHDAPAMPAAGSGTVAGNLARFIDQGMAVLYQVTPAFAGLLSQPGVLARFHQLTGGDAAFAAPADSAQHQPAPEPASLPDLLLAHLGAERQLGRIDTGADLDAAVSLIVGAMHGQVLPRVLMSPPGTGLTAPPGLAAQLAGTVLRGLEPRPVTA
jgi:AcrR family transcriptional regulator